VVIAGSLAQKPHQGGFAWVFLQYILGFQALGWDVLFVDRLEPDMCVDAAGRACALEDSENLRSFRRIMAGFGLERSHCLIYDGGERCIGLTREEVLAWTRRSSLLLNVMGFLDDEEILDAAPRVAFLDIDPGFPHMWRDLGLADVFARHDAHVTVGARIGSPDCLIPACGLDWIATRPPVVLDQWPVVSSSERPFTTVASWRGAYGPVEYRGSTFGLRVHEFRRHAELPRRSRQSFELALDIHPQETRDLALLREHHWTLVDPRRVAGDPWAYRAYVQASAAEFAVAKNMYTQTRSGWFSDRTVCYLASGKPAIVQDTGLDGLYPVGKGLLTFTSLEEAVEGIEEVSANYERHAEAARSIAEEYFDSRVVLRDLVRNLGVG